MKFTCYKNDLIEALQLVIRSVAVKPITSALAGIYLKANDRHLELQSNNYNTASTVKIPVNTEVGGEVVILGKKLYDFIRIMPDDTVSFSGNEAANIFSIESGGAKVDFLTIPVQEFPAVKVPETDKSFRIRAITFKDLVRKTVFATSKTDERPVFKGCFFEIHGDQIVLAATNTHRIAVCEGIIRDNYEDGAIIVPNDILRWMIQAIDPNDVENYIEVKYSQRQVTFAFNNIFLTARLIEGEFPPYKQLLEEREPVEFDNEDSRMWMSDKPPVIKVNKAEFREAVEFVALMARDGENNAIKLEIGRNRVKLSADSTDAGEAVKSVEAEIRGQDIQIAFNSDYFVDALRVMDAQQLRISFGKDNSTPAVIREIGNDNFAYVVTPVRY